MSVVLTCTWRPHGELPRLLAYLPQIKALYAHIVIALIDYDAETGAALERSPDIHLVLPPDGAHSRVTALRAACATDATHLHYCDMDRLIRWIETRPDELRRTVAAIPGADCLILGRTAAAYASHPEAMITTERVINEVASHLLDLPVDICAGSKGLSLPLVRFLLPRIPADGWGDVSWAILAQRAGFTVVYLAADGLDYETADRHQPRAADAAAQRRLADAIDRSPEEWARRVRVAQEILAEGLLAHKQPLNV
ncbi:MAG: hypothetical protein JWL77_1338 [Chthonomonadaceae bacterium]|nr:hypothetical protein [Chthonomonadaceae bacterium]